MKDRSKFAAIVLTVLLLTVAGIVFLFSRANIAITETIPRLQKQACDAYLTDIESTIRSTKAAQTRFRFYLEATSEEPFFYVSSPGTFETKGTLYSTDLSGYKIVKPSRSNVVYLISPSSPQDTSYFHVRNPCD